MSNIIIFRSNGLDKKCQTDLERLESLNVRLKDMVSQLMDSKLQIDDHLSVLRDLLPRMDGAQLAQVAEAVAKRK